MPSTDCNLSEFIDKQTHDKQHIKQTALKYLDKYKTHLCIYTDGSKDGAKTACSVYRQDHIEQYRLPDNTEVTDAELFAINAAIRNAICQDSYKDIAICTDSLSNIRAITNNRHNKLDQRFLPLQAAYIEANSKSINIVIVWVPAHVGIAGNEEADRLAKQALLLPDNEISTIPTTITDCYKKITAVINCQWQEQYDSNKGALHYKNIEPRVSRKIKYAAKSRYNERIITRLRIGHCLTHDRLHKYNNTISSNCTNCNVTEDINHFINCPYNNLQANINDANIYNILTDHTMSDMLAENIKKLKRNI